MILLRNMLLLLSISLLTFSVSDSFAQSNDIHIGLLIDNQSDVSSFARDDYKIALQAGIDEHNNDENKFEIFEGSTTYNNQTKVVGEFIDISDGAHAAINKIEFGAYDKYYLSLLEKTIRIAIEQYDETNTSPFESINDKFTNQEIYPFVINNTGHVVAHGYDSNRFVTSEPLANTLQNSDRNGAGEIYELLTLDGRDYAPIWLQYSWDLGEGDGPQMKRSLLTYHEPSGLVVGAGYDPPLDSNGNLVYGEEIHIPSTIGNGAEEKSIIVDEPEFSINHFVGPVNSKQVANVMEKINSDPKYLLISSTSTASSLQQDDNIYRTIPPSSKQIQPLIEKLTNDGITDIVILQRDDVWGNDFVSQVTSVNSTLSFIHLDEKLPPFIANDEKISSLVNKLEIKLNEINSSNSAVLYVGFEENLIKIFDEVGSNNINLDTKFYSADGVSDSENLLEKIDPVIVNVDFTTIKLDITESSRQAQLFELLETNDYYSLTTFDAAYVTSFVAYNTELENDYSDSNYNAKEFVLSGNPLTFNSIVAGSMQFDENGDMKISPNVKYGFSQIMQDGDSLRWITPGDSTPEPTPENESVDFIISIEDEAIKNMISNNQSANFDLIIDGLETSANLQVIVGYNYSYDNPIISTGNQTIVKDLNISPNAFFDGKIPIQIRLIDNSFVTSKSFTIFENSVNGQHFYENVSADVSIDTIDGYPFLSIDAVTASNSLHIQIFDKLMNPVVNIIPTTYDYTVNYRLPLDETFNPGQYTIHLTNEFSDSVVYTIDIDSSILDNINGESVIAVNNVHQVVDEYVIFGNDILNKVTAQHYTNGDNYPFIFDINTQLIIAHGFDGDRIGLNAVSVLESDRPWNEIQGDLLENGATWVQYSWPHPQTGEEQTKRSYLYQLDDMVIGSGYFLGAEPEPTIQINVTEELNLMTDSDGNLTIDGYILNPEEFGYVNASSITIETYLNTIPLMEQTYELNDDQ